LKTVITQDQNDGSMFLEAKLTFFSFLFLNFNLGLLPAFDCQLDCGQLESVGGRRPAHAGRRWRA
jgi:hypothetical protein